MFTICGDRLRSLNSGVPQRRQNARTVPLFLSS
jgi:hypothetical protein